MDRLAAAGLVSAAILVHFAVGPQSPVDAHAQEQGVHTFLRSVAEYETLRQRVFESLRPLAVTNDMDEIRSGVHARAAALRHARADARRGAVFNAPVGDLFRSQIREAFAAANDDPARLVAEMSEDGHTWRRAEVNGHFSWKTACATPVSVLGVLPPLPDFLQYRFVGVDLVLVDIDASYIVDVLPDAVEMRVSQ
jgi:hypothetical protein